jgi:hypothetical protein
MQDERLGIDEIGTPTEGSTVVPLRERYKVNKDPSALTNFLGALLNRKFFATRSTPGIRNNVAWDEVRSAEEQPAWCLIALEGEKEDVVCVSFPARSEYCQSTIFCLLNWYYFIVHVCAPSPLPFPQFTVDAEDATK